MIKYYQKQYGQIEFLCLLHLFTFILRGFGLSPQNSVNFLSGLMGLQIYLVVSQHAVLLNPYHTMKFITLYDLMDL